MTTVLVWSERPEPNAPGLRDCTYSSGLMGMVYAAWPYKPEVLYTVAEREALERSDTQPDETGANLYDLRDAIAKRYGKARTVNATSALPTLVTKTGIGIAVQGRLSNFPAGHRLRRWQPGFTGGHCIFAFALGGGRWQWLDPLAPNKFAGDTVSAADLNTFGKGLGQSITFKADEFKPVTTYTQAQMDAVAAARDAAVKERDAALARIAAGMKALGGA